MALLASHFAWEYNMTSTYTDRILGVASSLAIKTPTVVATTANIALSGLQVIDGVTLTEGNRVLVKDQTNPVENGIWNASSGRWARALDFNGARDVTEGTEIYVTRGNAGAALRYAVVTPGPI